MTSRTTVEQAWEVSYLVASGIGVVLAPCETVAAMVAENLARHGAEVLTVERVA